VNVSSLNGEVSSLFGAYYLARAGSCPDALRFEVAPFGVQVIVIQPGIVATILGSAGERLTDAQSRYRELGEALTRLIGTANERSKNVQQPEELGVIADALETDNPPTRIKVGTVAQQMTTARKAMSDTEWDASLRAGLCPPGMAFSVLNPNRFAYKLPDFSPADQTTYANHALVGIALSLSARTLTEEGALGSGVRG